MDYFLIFGDPLFKVVPAIIMALLLLLLAWIIASLARSLTVKVFKKLNVEKYTDKLGMADEETGCSLSFFGDLAFLVVFLLFIPGILDLLGMKNVSAPIASLVTKILDFIPNLIAAAIILVIGFFLAKIICKLLMPMLRKLNIDKIQEKAGIVATDTTSLSSIITYLVYVLILIPVITAALQVLNISAISDPAIAMLQKVVIFLPNIFVAIAIVIIGLFIAKIVGKLLDNVLSGVGLNTMIRKLVVTDESSLRGMSFSKIIGTAVEYIIAFLFIVQALNVLQLEVLQFVGEAIIGYLPLAVSALLIIFLAFLLGNWAEKIIGTKCPHGKMCGFMVKTMIMVFAFFMALGQLGVAPAIVNAAFIIILGAVSIAFAVAFGLGGKEFAANVLKKMEECHKQKEEHEE
ncbi:MAG: mechanosensitive ion channel [Acidaminococcaceae bacterium]